MPTISSSFTVNTLDEPVSVVAQYAPNSNPTSSQIHSTWQSGDLYMRTRYTNSSIWSNWMKIVGENGSETDFSFAISMYKTTANSSTPPSDVSSWADAPMNITAAKPYLWSRVQQKAWNESTQSYVVQSTSYIRLTGEDGADGADGKNAVRIDLSNESDMIACDADNKVVFNRSISTQVRLYDGADVKGTNNITVTVTDASGNVITSPNKMYPTIDPTSGVYVSAWTLTWNLNAGYIVSSTSYDVTVSITYNNVQYTTKFTLARIVSSAIYQLLPSVNEIAFGVDANNNYTPPSVDANCGYVKITESGTTPFSGSDVRNTTKETGAGYNGTAPYNIFYRFQNADGTYGGWQWMRDAGGTKNPILTVANDTSYVAVEFAMSSSATINTQVEGHVDDSNIIDRETVPIVKSGKKGANGTNGTNGTNGRDGADGADGKDGVDGVSATVTPSSISVTCNINGVVKTSTTKDLTFGLKVGNNVCSSVSAVQSGTLPSGVTLQYNQYAKVTGITISTTATASGMANGVSFSVTGTYNGKQYTSVCTLALIGALQGQAGQNGERGKTGRFYYYAGEFDKNNNTDTFSVSDIQVPFFSHGTNANGLPNCHLFDYDTNGSYTMYQMWQISGGGNWNAGDWNNDPWKTMWNDQKYLITEAQFTKYGQLASFVFNGDWQLSTDGTIDSQPYNTSSWDNPATIDGIPAYLCFESSDPLGNGVTIGEGISVSDPVSRSITVSNKGYKVIKVVVNTIGSGTLTISVSSTGMTTKTKTISSVGTYYIVVNTDTTTSSTITIIATKSSGTGNISLYKTSYAPNYCVDGRTGATYQNYATVRGTIVADNFYHKVCYFYGSGNCINGGAPYEKDDLEYPTSGTADIIEILQSQGGNWNMSNLNDQTILLPSPMLCEGKMVTIYVRVIKCTTHIYIGCVETNKMVRVWKINSSGILVPYNTSSDPQPTDTISLQWAYYVKACRQGSAAGEWGSETVVNIPDVLHIPQYVFVAQNGYWFQIR